MRRSTIALTSAKFLFFIFFPVIVFSQQPPQAIYNKNIRTVQFYNNGNQLSLPVFRLNSGDQLVLSFDDLDADVKNYYYTYQICDYNWQPVDISPLDYLKGFTQQRIPTYQYSSLAYTKYTHYQAILPAPNSVPTMSGNYIIKVFLDGDTTKLAFTRALLVVNNKVSVSMQVIQPFAPQYARTHQRVRFTLNTSQLNSFSPGQQVKVVVLQNSRWDNMQPTVPPSYINGNILQYDNEDIFVFPGSREWRWLDMRSFFLQSDREDSIVSDRKNFTDIFAKRDADRSGSKYVYYKDLNGTYSIETTEGLDPNIQGDYATVHFKYMPPGRVPFADKDVYLLGQLTDYQFNDANKMQFDALRGVYELNLFLKQGYYSYSYMFIDKNNRQRIQPDGDYFETENVYTVLVYYRSFNDQTDQLVGISSIDTRTDTPGISF